MLSPFSKTRPIKKSMSEYLIKYGKKQASTYLLSSLRFDINFFSIIKDYVHILVKSYNRAFHMHIDVFI